MEVGIRELRDHLSRYLDHVRGGAEIVVTDHGRAVARVVPLTEPRTLDRLIDDGAVTRASVPHAPLAGQPLPARGTVSDLVGEQRQ